MLGMKIKASMASLKTSGRDLIRLLHTEGKMHSCSKRWTNKIVQEDQSMVGSSSATSSKVISEDIK